MKTLLAIHSYAAARDQVFWSFPYWKLAGWDIAGFAPADSKHDWPAGTAHVVEFGRQGYAGSELTERFIKTWEIFVGDSRFDTYDSFCLIEYDGIILRTPEPHPGGLLTNHAVGPMPHCGLKSQTGGFHTPWWADRAAARIIAEEGRKMIGEGETEKGSPDMMLGLMVDRRKDLKWSQSKTWSRNGNCFVTTPHTMAEAIEAVRGGAWYVHGLRHKTELQQLLDAC